MSNYLLKKGGFFNPLALGFFVLGIAILGVVSYSAISVHDVRPSETPTAPETPLFPLPPLPEQEAVPTSTPTSTPPIELAPLPLVLRMECLGGKARAILSWENPNPHLGFMIFRTEVKNSGEAWTLLKKVSSPNYIDETIQNSLAYKYQIAAEVAPGQFRYSPITPLPKISCEIAPAPQPKPTPKPMPTSTPTSTPPAPQPAPSSTPAPAPTSTPARHLKWGAYPGWQTSEVADFENRVGGSMDHLAAFTHWANNAPFPSYLAPYAKDKGRTLIVFWEASDHKIGGTDQPLYSYDSILTGVWDQYIRSFAEQARAYGGPVILVPFSEMNGNWSPWSGTKNGNTPEKAKQGYIHVRKIFGDVPNVKFGWAVNSNSVPNTAENQIEKYFPGKEYVDYIGVDGFNFAAPWLTFDQIFGTMLKKLSTYGKPMYIFSFATAQGSQKAAWIRDALTVQIPKYPLIEGWNWFNQNKEKDWRVWSDEASLSAFKEAIR